MTASAANSTRVLQPLDRGKLKLKATISKPGDSAFFQIQNHQGSVGHWNSTCLNWGKCPNSFELMDIPDVREGTNEAAVTEFTRVVNEEDGFAQEIGSLRRRLDKIEQLWASVDEYGMNLATQADRLEGVGWLETKSRASINALFAQPHTPRVIHGLQTC